MLAGAVAGVQVPHGTAQQAAGNPGGNETARAVVFEGGGDYVFTVKDNQEGLNKEVARLLAEQPFCPS